MVKRVGKNNLRSIYASEPWSCFHESGQSRIEAFVAAAGRREAIAHVVSVARVPAKAIAQFIVDIVNSLEQREHLIDEMASALEICLESEKLSWAAEQEAEVALRHAQSRKKF